MLPRQLEKIGGSIGIFLAKYRSLIGKNIGVIGGAFTYRAPTVFEFEIPYFFKTFSRLKFVFFKTMSLRDKRKITVIRGLFSSPCMFNMHLYFTYV